MKVIEIVLAAFVFFLMQMFLVPRIAMGEITPDFPLLLVVFFAVNRTQTQASIAGFIVGLAQDLFNPELLGLNALTKSVTGYAFCLMARKAEPDNPVFMGGLVALAALGHDFLYLAFYTGLNIARYFVLFFTVAVPSALFTGIIGIFAYKVVAFLGVKVVKTFGKA